MVKETIRATSFGFIEVTFRNGGRKGIAVGDIKSVQSRTEGGATIRLQNDHTVLIACPFQAVMKAIGLASEGGDHAAA